jgi:membrane-bound lytic murein transglycosylase D
VATPDTLSTEEARDLAAIQAETFKGPVGSTNADLDDELERFLKEESDAILTETVDYDIPIVINERVEYFVDYFQNRVRNSFAKWLARSPQVAPYMRSRFRQEGLPEDLIYISLIESGFSPQATSRARAVGYWQFIAGTARQYGLRVDRWVDERRDIERSTEAAIAYLKDLHRMFGSWYLAAAAYNSGEGKIQKAIEKYGSENLWELAEFSYLRTETKDYVPKLIAATLIAKEPDKYGFIEIPALPSAEVDTVIVPTPTDLRAIAAAAGTDLETIKGLNPSLRSYATPPGAADFPVLVPRGSGTAFAERLATIPPPKRMVERYHVVKRGETPSRIAAKYGVSTSELMAENGIRNPRSLKVGQRLRVPGQEEVEDLEPPVELAGATGTGGERAAAPAESSPTAGASPPAETASAPAPADPPGYAGRPAQPASERGDVVRYRVRKGDNLFRIAAAHDVTVDDLKRWNPSVGSRIYPGQRLIVQAAETPSPAAAPEEVAAQTESAETAIAPDDDVAGAALADAKANVNADANVSEVSGAVPGDVTEQEVAAPVAAGEQVDDAVSLRAEGAPSTPGAEPPTAPTGAAEPAAPARHLVHVVEKGETVPTIAAEYDVTVQQVRLWNGLRGDRLREGERLVLFPGARPPGP